MTLISAVWPWPLLPIVVIAAVGLLVWDWWRERSYTWEARRRDDERRKLRNYLDGRRD